MPESVVNAELALLIEDMQQGGELPFQEYQRRIAALTDQLTDERDWNALLAVHKSFMDLIERRGELPPENLAKFQQIRRAEHRLFVTKEAMDAAGLVDPMKLDRLVRREVDAGRLDPSDDFVQFASDGVQVLCPGKAQGRGWLSRLFGR